ncbi:MAG: AEC family transporter [Pseudomonadota bacterium]
MSPILLAVAPIFGLILIGFALRRVEFPGPGFWPVSERLTYYVLFPALLVGGLSGRSFDESAVGLAATLFVSVCLVSALLLLFRRFLAMDGPAFTSVFQGAIRPNTYVGLSVAAALLGPDWMTLSAVALLTLVPLVNVLCVLVLARHGGNGGGVRRTALELAKNPLILACVAGFALNGLGIVLPVVVGDLLAIMGKAALPMGLLAVGAGLRGEGLRDSALPVAAASAIHLVLLPLAAFGCAQLLGLDPVSRQAALIFTAVPVSVSAFILARQMGGDHRLMALIITVQTLASALTLPLILAVLG